jgi:hypothetical protein
MSLATQRLVVPITAKDKARVERKATVAESPTRAVKSLLQHAFAETGRKDQSSAQVDASKGGRRMRP